MSLPIEIWYLVIVFAVAILGFSILKRPLYECMLASFLVLVACTGTWSQIGVFIWDALTEPSLYVIVVFVVSASLLAKTGVIDDCIAIIISVFGRLRGGAGFVAIIASTYMGSLSGSGPGNVATTGVFTIPAMKKSGFPAHLAANVEAHSSAMGNMIPPAGMIAVAFSSLDQLYPETYTMSQFWMALWGIAAIFVLQKILTLYILCRIYKVEPMKKEDRPGLRQSLKKGWKAIFLPLIVFFPFFVTSNFSAFFTERLGSSGASALNSSILMIIPALIVVCGVLLSGKKVIKQFTAPFVYKEICTGMKKVVPTSALVLFAYFVSNVLATINVETAIGAYISGLNLPMVALVFILPLFTAVLGMLIPGSTQVKIFGGVIISIFAAAGGNPMLAAAMLPCICGVPHGVTPPYCTCVYIAMGIADAELKPTMKENLIWIAGHYLLSVLVLLGMIPVLGLV